MAATSATTLYPGEYRGERDRSWRRERGYKARVKAEATARCLGEGGEYVTVVYPSTSRLRPVELRYCPEESRRMFDAVTTTPLLRTDHWQGLALGAGPLACVLGVLLTCFLVAAKFKKGMRGWVLLLLEWMTEVWGYGKRWLRGAALPVRMQTRGSLAFAEATLSALPLEFELLRKEEKRLPGRAPEERSLESVPLLEGVSTDGSSSLAIQVSVESPEDTATDKFNSDEEESSDDTEPVEDKPSPDSEPAAAEVSAALVGGTAAVDTKIEQEADDKPEEECPSEVEGVTLDDINAAVFGTIKKRDLVLNAIAAVVCEETNVEKESNQPTELKADDGATPTDAESSPDEDPFLLLPRTEATDDPVSPYSSQDAASRHECDDSLMNRPLSKEEESENEQNEGESSQAMDIEEPLQETMGEEESADQCSESVPEFVEEVDSEVLQIDEPQDVADQADREEPELKDTTIEFRETPVDFMSKKEHELLQDDAAASEEMSKEVTDAPINDPTDSSPQTYEEEEQNETPPIQEGCVESSPTAIPLNETVPAPYEDLKEEAPDDQAENESTGEALSTETAPINETSHEDTKAAVEESVTSDPPQLGLTTVEVTEETLDVVATSRQSSEIQKHVEQIKNTLLALLDSKELNTVHEEAVADHIQELLSLNPHHHRTDSHVLCLLWGDWELVYTTDRFVERIQAGLESTPLLQKTSLTLHIDGEHQHAYSELSIQAEIFSGEQSSLKIATSTEEPLALEQTLSGELHVDLPQVLTGLDLKKIQLPDRLTLLTIDLNVQRWMGALSGIARESSLRVSRLLPSLEPLIPESLLELLRSRLHQRLTVGYLDHQICLCVLSDAIYVFKKQQSDTT